MIMNSGLRAIHMARRASSTATGPVTKEFVKIVEVGARDGLQNEPTLVATATKIALVERLAQTGVAAVEAGAFVSAAWVPQMGDSAAVVGGVRRRAGVRYPVLVPNARGLRDALAAGAREVAVFGAASEAFSRRNINASVAESLARFAAVVDAARAAHVPVRAYVSTALGCPYEGRVDPAAAARLARTLLDMGCYEVSLGDTIGVGTPGDMARLLDEVEKLLPLDRVAVHCHDTYGQALANILVAVSRGVRVVDASVAGLGGCPYADGASGNVSTEDVVYMLSGMGYETGVDLPELIKVGFFISNEMNRQNNSRVANAMKKKLGL